MSKPQPYVRWSFKAYIIIRCVLCIYIM